MFTMLSKAERLEALVRYDTECRRLVGLENAARLRFGRVCQALRKGRLEGSPLEELGFSSFATFCHDRFGIGERTALRSIELYQACERFAHLKAAFLQRKLEQEKVLVLFAYLKRFPELEQVMVELAGRMTLRALREELRREPEGPGLVSRTYLLEPHQYRTVMQAVELCCLMAGKPSNHSHAWEMIVADLTAGLQTSRWLEDAELTPRRRSRRLERSLEEIYRQWDFLGLRRDPLELLEGELPHAAWTLQQEGFELLRTMRECQLALAQLLLGLERLGVPCFTSLSHYAEECLGIRPSTTRAMVLRERWMEKRPELRQAVLDGRLSLSQLDLMLPLFARGLPSEPWVSFAGRLTCKALERWMTFLKGLDRLSFESWCRRVPCLDDPTRESPAWMGFLPSLELAELALLPLAGLPLLLAWSRQMLSDEPDRPDSRVSFRVSLEPVSMLSLLRLECTVACAAGGELDRDTCAEAIALTFILSNQEEHALEGQQLRLMQRDHFTCCAPGCTRHENLQAHHVVFRSRGGSNADENLIMLCVACHLRLVHRGYLRISGQAGELRFERAGEVLLGEMRVVSVAPG